MTDKNYRWMLEELIASAELQRLDLLKQPTKKMYSDNELAVMNLTGFISGIYKALQTLDKVSVNND